MGEEKTNEIQCHYDVLSVPRDADVSTIKKAHRKLALKYHPDKNLNDDYCAEQFRLVQQAYECLSDPTERKWYDEHRDAILNGWKGTGDNDDVMNNMLFDTMPYMHPSCYDGYGDDANGFFATYSMVFDKIYEAEYASVDDASAPSNFFLIRSFGDSLSEWDHVQEFYQSWESFTSNLSYAWADKYDILEAPNRRVRRAMEEENKKARKIAKRQRVDDILTLVRFVKRRDPRVLSKQKQIQEENAKRKKQQRENERLKKIENQRAKEQWKIEAQKEMLEAEEKDRLAGRIRLADLDDDYDYGGGSGKKKKNKKNKNKKGKNGKTQSNKQQTTQDQDKEKGDNEEQTEHLQPDIDQPSEENGGEKSNEIIQDKAMPSHLQTDHAEKVYNVSQNLEEIEQQNHNNEISESEDESSEDEPEIFRCECCRKDFKSQGQMDNHFKSKKHKEKYKKYQAKMEKEIMDQIIGSD